MSKINDIENLIKQGESSRNIKGTAIKTFIVADGLLLFLKTNIAQSVISNVNRNVNDIIQNLNTTIIGTPIKMWQVGLFMMAIPCAEAYSIYAKNKKGGEKQ